MILVLGLTGCASMYDGMGIATKDSLVARDQRLAALEAQAQDSAAKAETLNSHVKDLDAQVAGIKDAAAKIAEVQALMTQLQGKVDQIPAQTLMKLSEVLARAAAETAAEGKSP